MSVLSLIPRWLIFALSISPFLFTACVQDNPHLADRSPVQPSAPGLCDGQNEVAACEDGERRTDHPCGADEPQCRVVYPESDCGAPHALYCRPEFECPTIDLDDSCPRGWIECQPGRDDQCRLEHAGDGRCSTDVYCQPQDSCDAFPGCSDDEVMSARPCNRADDQCRSVSVCGRTSYCRRRIDCLTIDQEVACPPGTTQCDPDRDDDCHIEVPGDGQCIAPLACSPVCQPTPPRCNERERQTQAPCQPGEVNCRIVSSCEQTIYCRTGICDGQPPACDDGEVSSDEPCHETEVEICRTVERCGRRLFCRQPTACPDIPAEIQPCPAGQQACEPEYDTDCQLVWVGDNCTPATYCAPDPSCGANRPVCRDGLMERPHPCQPGETSCTTMDFCGGQIFCDEIDVCDQAPRCDDDEIEDMGPCLAGEPECREVESCGLQIACRPNVQCDAFPACQPDEDESEIPCEDEEDCREEWACGEVVYCRSTNQCLAEAMCRSDERSSDEACQPDEDGCRAETMCGSTLFCRRIEVCPPIAYACPPSTQACDPSTPDCMAFIFGEGQCAQTIHCTEDIVCDAYPTCDEHEEESPFVCDPGEEGCRAVSACGETIVCRSRPADAQLSRCGDRLLPVDDFDIEATRIMGDTLVVTTVVTGGCGEHLYEACYRPIDPNEPIQFRMTIGLDANGDACERLVRRDIQFDLTVIKLLYRQFFAADAGQVSLFLTDAPRPLVYRF
ncbi:MAG: hypothetical protein VX589_13570 [Myxococcota bacterium]|nr:hypothetical protein [Myxococcota bacterium]